MLSTVGITDDLLYVVQHRSATYHNMLTHDVGGELLHAAAH